MMFLRAKQKQCYVIVVCDTYTHHQSRSGTTNLSRFINYYCFFAYYYAIHGVVHYELGTTMSLRVRVSCQVSVVKNVLLQ